MFCKNIYTKNEKKGVYRKSGLTNYKKIVFMLQKEIN